ncbi:hypothetical protein [Acinetobacter radioresistens]|uniref:hypothetical protein n=1 Tax=Acinetobacter radioresistens TaxID=40216 RepID=UPI002245CCEC|nr:hypothetical protein [Acinetobacter radioresistens]MCX0339827.1 hypothetical protein [Acinetobacter radioresistens]
MEDLQKLLNERFSRNDLKEYEVSFQIKEEENYELILSYKNLKFSVKTRDENLESWINFAKIYRENNEKFVLDSSYIYLTNLNSNRVEFRLSMLKSVGNYISYPNIQEYKINTEKGMVKIGYLSKEMILCIFQSDLYRDLFVHRVMPSIENRLGRGVRRYIYIEDLFRVRFKTAVFESFENIKKDDLKNFLNSARRVLNNCFYYLENKNYDAFSIANKTIKINPLNSPIDESELKEFNLPRVNYDAKLLAFYKNAYVSNTSSQAFLSYYHIAEYFFLKCTENNLYRQIKSFIDEPKFSTDEKNLSSMINVIKKHNYESDENKMLFCVIDSFIPSEELFRFVDESMGLKKFDEKSIFGEKIDNTAFDKTNIIKLTTQTIKIIRNGIVHSTDRYNRGDRYTPFTKDADIIQKYLPLMKFIAEKIIAANTI